MAYKLEEYTNKDGVTFYSIIDGWINKEDEFVVNKCKRRFGRDPQKKEAPISVRIGTLESVKQLRNELEKIIDKKDTPF